MEVPELDRLSGLPYRKRTAAIATSAVDAFGREACNPSWAPLYEAVAR